MVTEKIIKGRMIEQRLNGKKLAKMLGIAESTFSLKIREVGTTFTMSEFRILVRVLNLSNDEIVQIARRLK